jgi:hypothetical protein
MVGRKIDSRDQFSSNAASPRLEIRHPGSNANLERFQQRAKQDSAMVSIESIQVRNNHEMHSYQDPKSEQPLQMPKSKETNNF